MPTFCSPKFADNPSAVPAHNPLVLQLQLHLFPSKSASQNLKESSGKVELPWEGGREMERGQKGKSGKVYALMKS